MVHRLRVPLRSLVAILGRLPSRIKARSQYILWDHSGIYSAFRQYSTRRWRPLCLLGPVTPPSANGHNYILLISDYMA